MINLFETANHRNVMFDELTSGVMVQANQHIIVDKGEGIVLDPGGHKVYSRLLGEMSSIVPVKRLKYIFMSHQDPDILAAANGWLMVTDADAYLSQVWTRFIPHFGVDELVIHRVKAIPDEGMTLLLGDCPLMIIPAHFIHSAGNFQVYDPTAKILYSGDLGVSLGQPYSIVEDFDAHRQYIEGFHRRYLPGNKALQLWANMIRGLDIETIAPQHGAVYQGKAMVAAFLDWIEALPCGLDVMADLFKLPA